MFSIGWWKIVARAGTLSTRSSREPFPIWDMHCTLIVERSSSNFILGFRFKIHARIPPFHWLMPETTPQVKTFSTQNPLSMRAPRLTSDAYSLLLKNRPSPLNFNPARNSGNSPETNLRFGQTIDAHMIKTFQIEFDIVKTNTLINLYAKSGLILLASQLFNEMPHRNLVSWSILIAGYFHSGLSSHSLELFMSMNKGHSPPPNEFIFATVISSCADLQALGKGMQCHACVWKSGLISHAYVRNAIIHMYSRCSDVGGALSVFKTVAGVDSFSSNSMIGMFLEHGYFNEALEVLDKMVNEIVALDYVTYVTALNLCACLKCLRLGQQAHGQILRRHMEHNVYLAGAIVDMYGKCGQVSSARNAFDRSMERNVVSWTTIMTVYAQNGCFEESLNLYSEMELTGVRPNEFTFAIMLNSCASLSALRHGDLLNARLEKLGFKAHLVVGNALINMYSKSGNIKDASEIFSNMFHRDIISWNSMISGYSHHGLGFESLRVFQEMIMAREKPNYVTFVGVLSACAHLGLVNDGFYYLNHLMKEMGITPGLEHYTCIVGLLSRIGKLDDAEFFMQSTPIEWDVVAWRTLLSACQVHHNFALGKRVADVILQLDPNDAGTYILLSNMYAKARRWDGVVSVRKLMRSKEVKKEPGVSWIQVKNSTHVFISEDRHHPRSTSIYKKLEELIAEIKLMGYVPAFDTVLHDVEDEQKDENLRYHSEKLAIAFGLITMPLGALIHIIKNLRMCEDCHTAIKLISKVTNRKIIIRDAKRFHSFESGNCSCCDFW